MPKPKTKAASPIPRVDYDESAVEQAIKSVTEKDWQGFFESIRLQKYQQLKVADANGNQIQQDVQALVRVEAIFLSIKA